MSNDKISLIIAVATTVAAIAVIVFGLIRFIKNKPGQMSKKVLSGVLCLFLVVIVGANYACYAYNSVISTYFSEATASEEEIENVTTASRDLSEEIENEGAVLLENKGNTLPLDTENVNLFGWSVVDPIYGGAGSGAGDETNNIDVIAGLENAGFQVNEEVIDFYKSLGYKRDIGSTMGVFTYDFNIYEAPIEEYSDELIANAKEFSDTAILFFSRLGGEDTDLPTDMSEWGGTADEHYLELSAKEKDLLAMAKENFETVIVLINSSNVMELGFLEDENVDAALWVGGPGSTGCNSIGKILCGDVTPSGRLTDTYAYDITTSPAYYNAGNFNYIGADYTLQDMMTGGEIEKVRSFVNYAEGIYVGYRYYETRWIDNNTNACDEEAYQAAVQYPFGYGLSYTTFEQKITDFSSDGTKVTMDVTVTNTGSAAGKDVVQVYYTAPYYTGEIEKSHVVLCAFDKTSQLEPGASETLSVSFNIEDMASYDYINEKCYVLDAGNYEIKLMNNAHEMIDSRTIAVDTKIVYNSENPRSTDNTAAVNRFDDMTYGGDVTYVSRADWEGTLPTEKTQSKEATGELLAQIASVEVEDNDEDEDIVIRDNGLELADMEGLDYDDPKWEDLLEQLSVEDMVNLVGMGGYITVELDSINKPQTTESEGPAGISGFMNSISGVQYPSSVVLASTWNIELAQERGEAVGDEALIYGIDGLMAPAMNIHRTPFSGRNFEYYSEDGYISGMIGAYTVIGLNNRGVNTFVKHFALNDQETNRHGLSVWANEQSARELYFRPFELAVKIGKTQGIMSAFNRLGTTWCGASKELLTEVLRDEWGFVGTVLSDMGVYDYMDPDMGIRAGNDLMLSPVGFYPSERSTDTATGRQALRNASHNILYSIVNSSALEIAGRQVSVKWLIALGAADVVLMLAVLAAAYAVTGKKKNNSI